AADPLANLFAAGVGPALDEAERIVTEGALRAELQPFGDLTHSAAAKRQLAATLMRRAVRRMVA
ncbi:MAG: hypothetical protein H7Z19_00855, partial [Chitinophagaceae bacterium]|nr:hypothetical protein [Rubrivivax sp.]